MSSEPGLRAGPDRVAGERRLRAAIDDLANQLCVSVDGDFDFAVHAPLEDETLEKLAMLINFVLDTARRGMGALAERNQALAEIDRAKTVFFSNASHELRTPLTLILGPIEDALARPGGSLGGESLVLAHQNAVRLHKLVDTLLDFSRIEAGRLQARYEPTDLPALTAQLAGVFRAAVEQAGLTLTVETPPLAEPVYVDREMWEKIVLNLLSNAFKFTLEGGIGVTLREAGDAVELRVRDTGIGIPEELLPRLFERFFRVPDARGRTHEGFGIGLAMIQELVRLHGGSVSAESRPGEGATFTVRIPRGSAHLPAESLGSGRAPASSQARAFEMEAQGWRESPAAPTPVAERAGRSTRILLADDNADMRAYLEGLLGEHWTVESVADGEAALAAALRQPPDLVLADIMMPRRDGFGLMRALRADARTRDVPIVLLSARSGAEAVAEGLERGADDYLVKPFAARELLARVRTHLELSRLRTDDASIQRIGALLGERLDLSSVVQTLTDEATRLCGAAFGAFFFNVVDPEGERYMLYTLAGAPREAFEKFPLPRNTALFETTFSGRGTLRLDDVTQDPRYGRSAPHYGMPAGHLPVRSYLAVPVVSRSGQALGGLFFGHGDPGVFSERSERLLQAVAGQAGVAIDNSQLFESEQRARAHAEEASRAKDAFLAMLGHELRNPLAPIVTALEMMNLADDPATAAERGIIQRQVRHLVRLVDDLLDVSRITSGKVALDRAPVELSRIVAEGAEIARPLLEQRRSRLSVSVPERGLLVHGDLARLAQVVSNLLNNAAKYSEPGAAIALTGERDGAAAVLRVRDHGIGIAEELMPSVFEPFVQGRQTLARAQGGLGLGLAIVRSLVTAHGGSVEARSEGPGRGSEFEVRLPLHAAGSASAGDGRPAAAVESRACRVLVVDDNADAARLLAQALARLGHTTRTAGDGESALALAAGFRPDLVLLDLGLPLLDGYEVAQRLRRQVGSPLRIVAVTGYGQDADRRLSSAAGFDEHLVKPVTVTELSKRMARWFGAGA